MYSLIKRLICIKLLGFLLVLSAIPSVHAEYVKIDDVRPFINHHGSAPTAAGMIMAYWAQQGFSDLVKGDPGTQSEAVNNMIASQEHYYDYALPIETGQNLIPDKSELGGAHEDNCLAHWNVGE